MERDVRRGEFTNRIKGVGNYLTNMDTYRVAP